MHGIWLIDAARLVVQEVHQNHAPEVHVLLAQVVVNNNVSTDYGELVKIKLQTYLLHAVLELLAQHVISSLKVVIHA
mgnify:CR=1 FL=1